MLPPHTPHTGLFMFVSHPVMLAMPMAVQGVTWVSADSARGKSTGYSKWKMFCTHMHFEAFFIWDEIRV